MLQERMEVCEVGGLEYRGGEVGDVKELEPAVRCEEGQDVMFFDAGFGGEEFAGFGCVDAEAGGFAPLLSSEAITRGR